VLSASVGLVPLISDKKVDWKAKRVWRVFGSVLELLDSYPVECPIFREVLLVTKRC
jgi:hypothetical protein